jgi:transmembrane sensor
MSDPKSLKSLIIAWLDGNLSGAELEQLLQWMEQSPENASYVSRIRDIWQASLQKASEFAETGKEWDRFRSAVEIRIFEKKQQQRHLIRWLTGMAAVLLIGFIGGYWLNREPQKNEPIYITATAPAGSVASLLLADSTVVYLNAGSKLTYCPETNASNREVSLNGEAWFDVVKNSNNPFVVRTPVCQVQVLGTRFNVKAYEEENEVITTLEEGEIILGSSPEIKSAGEIRLLPGEQAVINKTTHKVSVEKVETRYFTSWKDNKLMFINMNMQELIVILERKFGVNIEVGEPSILNYHYTGTLKNESVIEVMELIKHTLPVNYHIDGQVIRIVKNKKGGS